MPFEGEPPNGDYAGYIDRVINRGQGTPGEQRLFQTGTGGVKARKGLANSEKGMLSPGEQAPTGTGMPSALTAPPPPSAHMPAGLSEPASPTTLAAQHRHVVSGVVQTVFGGIFALSALGSLITAIRADDVAPVHVVMTVLFFIAARNLLKKGLASLRGNARAPLVQYPPLKNRRPPVPDEYNP